MKEIGHTFLSSKAVLIGTLSATSALVAQADTPFEAEFGLQC